MNDKLRKMRGNGKRMLSSRYLSRTTERILISSSSIYILLSLLVGAISASSNYSTNLTNTLEISNRSAPLTKTLQSKGGEQQVVIVEPQQSQSTDVSSMYVQIPIAEPSETGVPDGVQQTLTSEPDGSTGANGQDDDGGQSKWTGPWPKKFQIGYIKQSDLHQVLIESLKGDTFTSLTSPTKSSSNSGQQQISGSSTPAPSTKSLTSASAASTKTSSSSDGSSLASGATQGASVWPVSHTPVSSRQPIGTSKSGNIYLAARQPSLTSGQSNFRDPKLIQQTMQQLVHRQFNQFGNSQLPIRFPLASRHYPITTNFGQHLQQQQQHQFQFAGYPSSFVKNQPMYMINNFPAQEQMDLQNPMIIQQQQQQIPFTNQVATRNQQKPAGDYYSSWRPVSTSSESKFEQQSSGRPVFQAQDYGSSFVDEFDDGFTTPVRTEPPPSLANMNRHPMLNNYLPSEGSTNAGSKTSASTKSRPRASNPPPTKGGSRSESTKGVAKSSPAPSSSDSSEKNLSVSGRRGATNSSSSSSSGTTSDGQDSSISTTPMSLSSSSTETSTTQSSTSAGNGSTVASVSSTTNVMSTTLSSTNTESTETTEPDSETVDSELETTEPSTATTTAATSTTASSLMNASGSTTADGTASSTGSTRADESEVATQSTSTKVRTASLPSVDDNVVTNSATSGREETTPASTAAAASNEQVTKIGSGKAGEVEGSMSDEALQAAAVRSGSDIGKSSNSGNAQSLTQSASSTVRAKQTRSSERLQSQQQQPTSRRKNTSSATKGSGKQRESVGKVANGVKSATTGSTKSRVLSSARSGKQANESKELNSTKAGRQIKAVAQKKGKSSANSTSSKTNSKTTRMIAQSQSQTQAQTQLQQQQQQQQNERLQTAPQIVSMTAAQAQSTAQTLASLLLSRCMSSTSCAHLLDVCSTKQATVSLNSVKSNSNGELQGAIGTNSSAWSMPVGLPSSGLMNLAQALQADRSLRMFPQWKEACENLIDQGAQTGYTLILPSNEAIDRLPAATLSQLQSSSDSLNQLIENHMLDSAEVIEIHSTSNSSPSFKSSEEQQKSRLIQNKGLQVNQHRDRMVTINGKRLVYANQQAPAGGRIHVIDGLLEYPTASTGGSQGKLLDIMDTLKQCDKFDGFVTLAEGTGLTQILKQDGPMTVFVPSNEALRKIPDEELEVIKNNSTALKEFLMYHVVNGSYFSQDLRDGQQLSSILDMKPIQVGVRVDGCSRRLVEANTSPMRRPDIVAKNGVIHILDWYLTVRDNEWCDPIGRSPVINSPPDTLSSSSTSERLQHLASESSDAYATRLVIPANHKPAHNTATTKQQHHHHEQLVATNQQYAAPTTFTKNYPNQISSLSHLPTTSSNEFEKPHNIIVSATPSLDQAAPEKKA